MGTRGDDPTRNPLGSAPKKVVALFQAPVLTVRIQDRDAGAAAAADSAVPTTD